MEDEPTTQKVWPSILRALIACWFLFLGTVTSLTAIVSVVTEPDIVSIVFTAMGTLLVATGIGLLRKSPWAVWTAVAANVGWVAWLVVASLTASGGWVEWMLSAFAATWLTPGLFMWFRPMRTELTGPDSDTARDVVLRIARPLLLLGGGLAVVGLVVAEGARVRANFDEYRFQNRCDETGDAYPCAHAALKRLRWAETNEQVDSAVKQFRDVCEKHQNGLACLWWAHTQSSWGLPYTGDAADIFRRYRRKKLEPICEAGDILACWSLSRIEPDSTDVLEPQRSRIEKDCEKADPFACDLLASRPLGSRSIDPTSEASKRACAAGFRRHCGEEESPLSSCLDGDAKACEQAAEATESVVEQQAIRMFSEPSHVGRNPGFIGFTPREDPGFEEACGPAAPVACLAWGLTLTRAETESWTPELPPLADLDASYGRACELGVDAACRAYATRLLDVFDPGADRIAKANEVVAVACERGDADACWMRDVSADVERGKLDGLRDLARTTCLLSREEEHPACATYANLVAFEHDASLSPMDDRLYFEHLRDICRDTGNSGACWRLAWFSMDEKVTPIRGRRIAYDAASLVCAQRETRGCEALREVPRVFSDGAPDSDEELRVSACEKVGVCLK